MNWKIQTDTGWHDEFKQRMRFAEYMIVKRNKVDNLYSVTAASLFIAIAILAITIAASIKGDTGVYIQSLSFSAANVAFGFITNLRAYYLLYEVDAEIVRMQLSHDEND